MNMQQRNADILEAIEESTQMLSTRDTDKNILGKIFTIALFVFVVFFLLIGIFLGTKVYQSIHFTGEQTEQLRLSSNIIGGLVKANDTIGAVSEGQGPEGKSLVLRQNTDVGVFEIRIYEYLGHIVQEYSVEGSEYSPYRADEIAVSDTFDFTYESGMLTITTDDGTTKVALRTGNVGEGGEDA